MENKLKEIVTKLKNPSGRYAKQGEVYISLPQNYGNEKPCPLVIALHGSGREALSYKEVPFYRKQRDIALESGYVFAAVSNGPDTYGLDDGFSNVVKLYKHMTDEYNVYKQVALWASSAGGLMMHRFYRANKDICKLLLGIFPVFDPQTMPPIKSMLSAFGASDIEELREKAILLSPQLFPQDIYEGMEIVIAHGKDDVTVPIGQSKKLYKQVEENGGEMQLIQKSGGHSIENFALYDTPHFERVLINFKNKLRNSFQK